ncbi:hypothetical protein E4634_09615 [Mangrovimicrobium sediminis]|uniref:Uncharacterized protein n=1 Tax=Mangrovimicrobium sediminis TaxID=2562682 RepID=A0A4Z0M1X7_9GAMM|nr:hypothetical protein [Haliea sp. SAOS-164]TGD73285.1 hypothetical protein E4634_09615 [Haliea sp. SAOS-164]
MTRRKRILVILLLVLVLPAAGVGVTALLAPQVLLSLFMPPPAAPDPPPPPVKFAVESTEVGQFLDHPVARKWLDKYFPGLREAEQVELTRRLTLVQVQPYFPELISDEALAALSAELAPLPPLEPVVVYSSGQTELGTILDDAQAREIVEAHIPGFFDDDRINMARPFTMKFLQIHIPDVMTEERLHAIDADFAALAEARAESATP